MRSLLTGMLIGTVTMVFATWFLSSTILKTIQSSKSSVSSVSSESLSKKINPDKDSYTKSKPAMYNYKNSPQSYSSWGGSTSFKKTSSPFGAKLNIRGPANPFAPKLSLRGRRSQEWGRKRKTEIYQAQKQDQQTNTSSKSTSSSPIISGYQNYIDILNEQMKD